jgi:dihydroorotase-like cyclic amidohydrolase
MGLSTLCRATFKGRSSVGRVELETDFVSFRGAFSVKLRFASIAEVSVTDGVLRLRAEDGTLALPLGAAAERWAEKIASPKSRIAKLGVKAGQRVSVVGVADAQLVAELRAAGADVSLRSRTASDAIFFAVESARDLQRFGKVRPSLRPDGAIWAIRRKGVPDASEAVTMAAGRAAGLVDVKVVRFSDTHTAEKFVIPKAKRHLGP